MRAFIVGNGPSLNQTPLERLIGETCFAVNRIHLIYPRTKWRPTHWTAFDRTRQSQGVWIEDIWLHAELGEEVYVRDDIKCASELPKLPNVHMETVCKHMSPMDSTNPAEFGGPWHLPQLCRYGGSTLMSIQLAVRLGYDDLYVVGCDLGYKDADNVNWFDKNYLPPDTYKADQARRWNALLEEAHGIAARECAGLGVRIRNAGIGGDLRAYPRVSFDSALKATTA